MTARQTGLIAIAACTAAMASVWAVPTTQPAAGSAPTASAPVTGPASRPAFRLTVQAQRKKDDSADIRQVAGVWELAITSISGIGDMTFASATEAWPEKIAIRLFHAADGKSPFGMLESFGAEIRSADGKKLADLKHKVETVKGAKVVTLTLPADAKAPLLFIVWIDAYR